MLRYLGIFAYINYKFSLILRNYVYSWPGKLGLMAELLNSVL